MKQEFYEIWRHEESQTWRVFTNMTQELSRTLTSAGWNQIIQYKEAVNGEQEKMCPEELLRRVSRANPKK